MFKIMIITIVRHIIIEPVNSEFIIVSVYNFEENTSSSFNIFYRCIFIWDEKENIKNYRNKFHEKINI